MLNLFANFMMPGGFELIIILLVVLFVFIAPVLLIIFLIKQNTKNRQLLNDLNRLQNQEKKKEDG